MAAKLPRIKSLQDLIVYEDETIILVNKPLQMASLADKGNLHLQALAKAYDENLMLCHRLDKNTSGILLMARNPEAYRNIAIQFEKRQVSKTYLTLAGGVHHFDNHLIDLPLYVSTNKRVVVSKQQGKPSQTKVTAEEQFKHATLLRCEPITGRMHQIRVHLAAIHCPIIGDQLYGGKDLFLSKLKKNYQHSSRREEQPINHGFLLHAHQLQFTHPQTGEAFIQQAELPKNFATTMKILRKYDAR
ncbi:MAG: RluA family pseudouridine synthase [Bacteroidota bacterium]